MKTNMYAVQKSNKNVAGHNTTIHASPAAQRNKKKIKNGVDIGQNNIHRRSTHEQETCV